MIGHRNFCCEDGVDAQRVDHQLICEIQDPQTDEDGVESEYYFFLAPNKSYVFYFAIRSDRMKEMNLRLLAKVLPSGLLSMLREG